MDVGDLSNGTASEPPKGSTSRLTPLIIDELSGLSLGDDEEAPVEESKPVKDPRRIARKYGIFILALYFHFAVMCLLCC